jgi:hypothetical protein
MFRKQKQKETLVTEVLAAVRSRLLINTILGIFTVLATGFSAAFGFYARELPGTLRSLRISIDSLNSTMKEQEVINERQDQENRGLDRRVTILETKVDDK